MAEGAGRGVRQPGNKTWQNCFFALLFAFFFLLYSRERPGVADYDCLLALKPIINIPFNTGLKVYLF